MTDYEQKFEINVNTEREKPGEPPLAFVELRLDGPVQRKIDFTVPQAFLGDSLELILDVITDARSCHSDSYRFSKTIKLRLEPQAES